MKLAALGTVLQLRDRLRDADQTILYLNDMHKDARPVMIRLAESSLQLPADLFLPYLRTQRQEIILDLASYGVSVS